MRTGKMVLSGCLLLIIIVGAARAQGTKYEAETAQMAGSLKVESTITGYSGTGYVSKFEFADDKLTFLFNLSTKNTYDLYIGYAAPYGDKINIVTINGNRAEVQFKNQGSNFREAAFGKVRLKEGENTVMITKSWGWFMIDYIRIAINTTPDTPFNISSTLATPEPAGKYPALLGLDLMNHTRTYSWFDKNVLINEATSWYANHGLVALCWHWRDPLRKTEEFYTEKTTFDISRISDTLSAEYKAMVSDIDMVAVWLKALKSADIPVLFRPLHEASGAWFWWGAKGPEPCKALWKLIFNRLTVKHEINNLIWVWTTDGKDDNLDWYPGDDYVDILGVDIYSQNGDFSSQVLTFDKVRESFGGKKMITLSENGVMPDPDNLVADESGWSWFMTWNGDFVRNPAVNPLSLWQKIMNHQYVLTRDEMPDRSGPTSTFRIPEGTESYEVVADFTRQRLMVTPVDQFREYNIRIFDLCGRIRGFYPNQTGDASVGLNQITEGIYIIRLESIGLIENFKIAF
ncbi:MAG: glycosyl hydrolase [Bacteroidia bacterium]|nr:glycosyl hydrolase [Bacteroidia bacterium]